VGGAGQCGRGGWEGACWDPRGGPAQHSPGTAPRTPTGAPWEDLQLLLQEPEVAPNWEQGNKTGGKARLGGAGRQGRASRPPRAPRSALGNFKASRRCGSKPGGGEDPTGKLTMPNTMWPPAPQLPAPTSVPIPATVGTQRELSHPAPHPGRPRVPPVPSPHPSAWHRLPVGREVASEDRGQKAVEFLSLLLLRCYQFAIFTSLALQCSSQWP